MNEERAIYAGETPDNTQHEIRDEAPVSHFSQIPNIVDDMGLTPYAYRLYGHLRRVAGEKGKCWQSTDTLAKSCGMSAGKVSEAKKELESVWPPLIRVTSKRKPDGSTYHEIFITDIWKINNQFYTSVQDEPVHLVKGLARSPGETYRSRGESKNNPIDQEEPVNDNDDVAKIAVKLALLTELYTQNIGAPTGLIADMLRNAAIEFPAEWYEGAFKIAVANNARNWKYIDTILCNWRDKGRDWVPQKPQKNLGPKYPGNKLASQAAELEEWLAQKEKEKNGQPVRYR